MALVEGIGTSCYLRAWVMAATSLRVRRLGLLSSLFPARMKRTCTVRQPHTLRESVKVSLLRVHLGLGVPVGKKLNKRIGRNGRVRGLTPSAVEALQRIGDGERVEEIASDWGTSKKTVYMSLAQARRVLGARTDAHAVSLWISQQTLRDHRLVRTNGKAR
jgi:DNA-binding CsgD family transcriptional regulator